MDERPLRTEAGLYRLAKGIALAKLHLRYGAPYQWPAYRLTFPLFLKVLRAPRKRFRFHMTEVTSLLLSNVTENVYVHPSRR